MVPLVVFGEGLVYAQYMYSGNHHTWNNNFLVLLLTTLEFISITISLNANLTT